MAETKKYVDQAGLQKFAELLKDKIYVKDEVYNKEEVDDLISSIEGFDVKVVESLPTASADTMYAIYLVAKGGGKTGYTEHITLRSGAEGSYTYAWEEIGDTEIDLSDYVKKEEGKGLSTNDLTDELKASYDGAVTTANSASSAAEEAGRKADSALNIIGDATKGLIKMVGDNATAAAAAQTAADNAMGAAQGAQGAAGTAQDAADAAQATATEALENAAAADTKAVAAQQSAEAAEEHAMSYADSLVKDADGKSLFDRAGAASDAAGNVRDAIMGDGTSTIGELETRLEDVEDTAQLGYFANRLLTDKASEEELANWFTVNESGSFTIKKGVIKTIDDLVTTGGEPNVIETVKVNGEALTVTDKAVDIAVPTAGSLTYDSTDNKWTGVAGYVDGTSLATTMTAYDDKLKEDLQDAIVCEIVSGETVGTIKYAKAGAPSTYTEVAVTGLGSAAFEDVTTIERSLIGGVDDKPSDDTINGAKNYAHDLLFDEQGIEKYDVAGNASQAESNACDYAKGLVFDEHDDPKFDAAGLAEGMYEELLGTAADTKVDKTIYGVIAYANDAASAVQGNTTETVASVDAKIAALDTTAALSNDEVTAAFNEVFG